MSTADIDGGSPNIVQALGVSRRYGAGEAAVDALVDVSVGFPSGRFAAIMGPSGSGKSTLMHTLAGLDRPTSGSVAIDGVDLGGLDDRKLTPRSPPSNRRASTTSTAWNGRRAPTRCCQRSNTAARSWRRPTPNPTT
ncbi:MAG TPA: ATP-binding cassette domain-containing protein [Solirubrobacteraceae bacterium]